MEINNETSTISIFNKEFEFEFDGKDYRIDSDYVEIQDLEIDSAQYIDNLIIRAHSSDGFGTYLFHEVEIFKADNEISFVFICNQPNKYWEGKYGLSTLLMELGQNVNLSDELKADLETLDIENDWKYLEVYFNVSGNLKISEVIDKYSNKLRKLIKQTELLLSGAVWKKEYETEEKLFSTEILYPLLRKMGFIDVRYTHGKREYGKDFTFSDVTAFGNLRHYGMQVKAGNMRGNVNADIDEIIGQLDDAFSMPYFEVTANEERRINTFVIAISGNFTENAKEKIANKIPNTLKGSVYMLDREKVMELIEKYWK